MAGCREVAGVEAETVTTTFGCVEKPSFVVVEFSDSYWFCHLFRLTDAVADTSQPGNMSATTGRRFTGAALVDSSTIATCTATKSS